MFIGKYYHSLEAKGRVLLPKALRGHDKTWVVTRGLDGCLFIFTQTEFKTQLGPYVDSPFTKKNSRDFIRLMAGEAVEIELDSLGRLSLPEHLITAGQLTKQLVIVGAMTRIELWDMTLYHQYLDRLLPAAESIAEAQSIYATSTGSSN